MKKFLVSLLCVCMVVVMMPFTGNVEFSASATTYSYEASDEASKLMGWSFTTDTDGYYYYSFSNGNNLKTGGISGPTSGEKKVEINLNGSNTIRFTDAISDCEVVLKGSGLFRLPSGTNDFTCKTLTIDGPWVEIKGLVSATSITVKSGNLDVGQLNAGTYTQYGGIVAVDYKYSTTTNCIGFDETNGYKYKVGHENAMNVGTLNVNGGKLNVKTDFEEYIYSSYTWASLCNLKASETNGSSNAIHVTGNATVNGGIVTAEHNGYNHFFTSHTNASLVGNTIYASNSNNDCVEATAFEVDGTLNVGGGVIYANNNVPKCVENKATAVLAGSYNETSNCVFYKRWKYDENKYHVEGCMEGINDKKPDTLTTWDNVVISEEYNKSVNNRYSLGGEIIDGALGVTDDHALTLSDTVVSSENVVIDGKTDTLSNLTFGTEKNASITDIVTATDTCLFAKKVDLSGQFEAELYTSDTLTIATDTTLGEDAFVEAHEVVVNEGATLTVNGLLRSRGTVTLEKDAKLIVNGEVTVRTSYKPLGSDKEIAFILKDGAYVSGVNGIIAVNSCDCLTMTRDEATRIYGMVDYLNDDSNTVGDVILAVATASNDAYGYDYNNGCYSNGAYVVKTGIYPMWIGGERVVVSGTSYRNNREDANPAEWEATSASGTDYFEAFKYVGNKFDSKKADTEIIYYPQTPTLPAKLVVKNANINKTNVVGPECDRSYCNLSFGSYSDVATYDTAARAAIYSNTPIDVQYEGEDNEIQISNAFSGSIADYAEVYAGIFSPYSVSLYSNPSATATNNVFNIYGAKNSTVWSELGYNNKALAVGIFGDNVVLGASLKDYANNGATATNYNVDNNSQINIISAELNGCENAITAGVFAENDAVVASEKVTINSGKADGQNVETYGIYALDNVNILKSDEIKVSNDGGGKGEAIHACDSFFADSIKTLNAYGITRAVRAFSGKNDSINPYYYGIGYHPLSEYRYGYQFRSQLTSPTNEIVIENVESGTLSAGSGLKALFVDMENADVNIEAKTSDGIGIEAIELTIDSELSSGSKINITAGTGEVGYKGIQALYTDIDNNAEVNITTFKNDKENNTGLKKDEIAHSYGIFIGVGKEFNEYDYDLGHHGSNFGVLVGGNAKLNINKGFTSDTNEKMSDFGIYTMMEIANHHCQNSYFRASSDSNVNINAKNVGIYTTYVRTYDKANLDVKTYSEGETFEYGGASPSDILISHQGIYSYKTRLEGKSTINVDSASTGLVAKSVKSINKSKLNVSAKETAIDAFDLYAKNGAKINATSTDGIAIDVYNINAEDAAKVNANGKTTGIDANTVMVEDKAKVNAEAEETGIVAHLTMRVDDRAKVNAEANNFGIDADKLWVVDRAKVTGTAVATGTDNSIGVNADLLWVEGNANVSTNTNKQFAILTGNGGKIGIKTDHLWLLKDKHFTKVVANGGDYGIEVDNYSYINDGYVYAYGEKAAIHASGTDSLNLDLGEGYKVVKTFATKTSIKDIETVTGTNTMGLDYESYVKFTSGTNAVQTMEEDDVANTVLIYYPMEVLVYTDVHNTEAFNGFKTLPYDEANHTVFVTGEICSWIRDYNPKEGFNVPRQVEVGAYTGYDWYNELYMARGNYKVKIEQNGEDVTNDIDGSSNMLGSYFGEGVYVLKYVRGDNNVFSRPVDLSFASETISVGSTTDLGNGITVKRTCENSYIVTLDNVTIDLEHYAQFMSTDAALKLPEGDVTLFVSGTNYIMAADSDDANYTRMVYGIKQRDYDNTITNTLTFDGNDGATLNVVGSENVLKLYQSGEVIGMADNRYLTVQSATYTNMNIIDQVIVDKKDLTKYVASKTELVDGKLKVWTTYPSETDASPTDVPTQTDVRTAVFKINKFTPTIRDHSYNYNYAIYGTTYHYNGSKLSSFSVSTNAGRTVSLNTELGKADKYFAVSGSDAWYFTSKDEANFAVENYLDDTDTNSNDSLVSVIAATNTDQSNTFNLNGKVDMSPVAKNVDEKNAVTYFACGNATAKAGVNVKKYIAPVYYGGPVAPAPVTTTYTVTFNANGHGTNPAAKTVTSGSKVTSPAAPTADGYVFGGWYKEASCLTAFDFSSAVTSNVTLYAKWTEADEEFDLAGALAKIKLKASTVYTSKDNTKVTATVVEGQSAIDEIKAEGYSVYYRFYRSTAAKKGYKSRVTKTAGTYLNNEGVLGTRYYYKAVLVIKNENGSEVGKTALTQCTYGKRVFKGEVEED